MAEANNGPNLEGVPKVSTKKAAPAKRAKPAGAVARPKRFQ